MQAAEFVEPYPRTLPLYEELVALPPTALSPKENAMAWGYRFGQLLHDRLSGRLPDTFTTEREIANYAQWNNSSATLTGQFELYGTSTETAQLGNRNRVNFHSLNRSLLSFWRPLIDGAWMPPERPRPYMLHLAQDSLAFEACCYLLDREEVVEQGGGTHVLFEPDMVKKNEIATGVIQEFDGAIMVLQAMRGRILKPSTLLLPAPPQFERTDADLNVNLIVVDMERHRAVGVQVESHARRRDARNADRDRVVFIDGDIDLGNSMPVRHSGRSSHEQSTAWPGIIAAKKMCEMTFKGKGATPALTSMREVFGPLHWQTILMLQTMKQAQHYARRSAGHLRVEFDAIAKRVGERITAKL